MQVSAPWQFSKINQALSYLSTSLILDIYFCPNYFLCYNLKDLVE